MAWCKILRPPIVFISCLGALAAALNRTVYQNLNISLLSCNQSIHDLTYSDLEDVIFFEGQVDDENRIEIENHQNYHLKCRELLLMKINQFLY